MKRTITYLLLILPLLWLAGCGSEDEPYDRGGTQPGGEIRFNIGFGPTTKVITDASFNSTFENGDEVGIFALTNGTNILVAQNVKLTKQADGSWSAEDKIYYPLDGDKLDFYAYYPYDESVTDPRNISFAVKADQRAVADYGKSDLMTATAKGQYSNLVDLTFSHLMAMVQVTVGRVSPVPAFREGEDGFKVILRNVKRGSTAIDWTSGKAGVDATAGSGDITMCRVPTTDGSWVFRALIPSQQIEEGKLFSFVQTLRGNAIDMGYKITSEVTPAAGKAATYKITLNYQLDADHVYNVGDVYPYKGTPVGIVFYTGNGGKSGKIVSLEEKTLIRWSDALYDGLGIMGNNNGKINMSIIADKITADNLEWSNFPAFGWIHIKNPVNIDYGDTNSVGVWCLPSILELQYLYCAINEKAFEAWSYYPSWGESQNTVAIDAFNQKLLSAGGEELGYNSQQFPYYWSSSVGGIGTKNLDFTRGYSASILQDYSPGILARAVMDF